MDSNLQNDDPLLLTETDSVEIASTPLLVKEELSSTVTDEIGDGSISGKEFSDHSTLSGDFDYHYEDEQCGFTEPYYGERFLEEEEDLCNCSEPSLVTRLTVQSYKSGWARFGMDPDPWADEKQPLCQVLDYNDFELTDEEKEGVLTDRVVYACSSFLDKNPESLKYTLSKLVARNKALYDIQILEAHRYLQYIDLSHNSLKNIWPLSGVPYLMHLNVSHNELTEVLSFKAPWNLTYVDFSFNQISCINDLTEFWSLVYLDLSNNDIKKIEGLQNLRYLKYLNLSMNSIECFENLNHMQIEALDISRNLITTYEEGPDVGMKTMTNLSILDIYYNNLTSLAIFRGVYHLKVCNLEENQVAELYEIDHMKTLRELSDLTLSGNAMTKWPKYRAMVIHTIKTLTVLDKIPVETQERVGAAATFEPNVHIKAACNHAKLQILAEINNTPELGLDIIPVDQGPYPLVVLVGPDGSMQEDLVSWITTHCEDKVYKGVNHTSRPKSWSEVHGKDNYFVTQQEFNELARSGTFLYITELLGDSYGFSRHEVEKAVKLNKLCFAEMDILGALTLRAYGIEPTLVLTIAANESLHYDRLRRKYRASLLQTSTIASIASMASAAASCSGRKEPRGDHDANDDPTSETSTILTDDANLKTKVTSFETGHDEHSSPDDVRTASEESFDSVCCSEEELEINDFHQPVESKVEESVASITRMDFNYYYQNLADSAPDFENELKQVPSVRMSHEAIGSASEQISRSDVLVTGSRMSKNSSSRAYVQFQDRSLIFDAKECDESSTMITSISEVMKGISQTSRPSSEVSSQSQVTQLESNSVSTVGKNAFTSVEAVIGEVNDLTESEQTKENSFLNGNESGKNCENELADVDNFLFTVPLVSASEDAYIKAVLNTRETYFTTHTENPGMFADTFYTDDLIAARKKFERFVKATYTYRPKQYPIFNIEEDKAYQAMTSRRLDEFKVEIYNEQRSMAKQLDEMTKYKPPRVPPQRELTVIDSEMRSDPNPPRPPCAV